MTIEDYVHKALLSGSRGGFACQLAEAWCRADSTNRDILEGSFPDIFRPALTRHINVRIEIKARIGSFGQRDSDDQIACAVKDQLDRLVVSGFADWFGVELLP